MSHKSLLRLAVIAALAASPWLQPTASYAQAPTARDLPALIVLVRHAERASQPKDDPPLSAAGTQRAEDLKAVLSHTKLTAIITTQYLRMRDTAHPTATALGLTPEIFPVRDVYNSEEIDGHVKSVVGALRRHVGASVLVVGHGNMISDIIAALGGPRLPIVCDHVFDHLFVLAPTTGRIQLVNARYGTPSPPPGPDCM
jgi:broad specificity phosphatase PhoE